MGLRERKKQQTRDALYAAARDLFREQGVAETTLGQIADAAGVSIPTVRNYFGDKDGIVAYQLRREIYKNFEDKDGLLVQLVQRATAPPEAWSAPAAATASALEALSLSHAKPRDLLANHMRVVASRPDGAMLLSVFTAAVQAALEVGVEKGAIRRDVSTDRLARQVAALIPGAVISAVQNAALPPIAYTMVVLAFVRDLIVPEPGESGASEAIGAHAERLEAIAFAPPQPRRPRKRGTLRARICTVARRRFLQDGIEATRISEIAAELSISPLTVHYHYGNKDGLIVELLFDLVDGVEALADELLASEAARGERTERALARLEALTDAHRPLAAELLRVSSTHEDGLLAADALRRCLCRYVEARAARGDVRSDYGPRVLARCLYDVAQGFLIRWIQEPDLGAGEAGREALGAFDRLLAPAAAAPDPGAWPRPPRGA